MKILIAVDGSDCSDAAVAAIANRPLVEGTEIRVLSVVESPYVPSPETLALPENYFEEMDKVAQDQAQTAVKSATSRLESAHGSKVGVHGVIAKGHPKEAILDEADKWGADLVVLGSHGYRGWQRFLLGSVSQAVASHANCSVEIVRHKVSSAQ